MAFNVTYSFNNGAVTGTATNYIDLVDAIHDDDYTQITLSGTIEGNIGYETYLHDALFENCSSLTSVDLSNLDTSNVTYMHYMFRGCYDLENLNLSNLDTSNVIDMSHMFASCASLTNLDLSSFNTSNVTNMIYMFDDCSSLTTLDLSSFDTSNVTGMESMFEECSSLTTLDLSSFDTSNVTGMDDMFSYCPNLCLISVSNKFTTTQVEESNRMFDYCTALPNFDYTKTDKTMAYIGGYFNGPTKIINSYVNKNNINYKIAIDNDVYNNKIDNIHRNIVNLKTEIDFTAYNWLNYDPYAKCYMFDYDFSTLDVEFFMNFDVYISPYTDTEDITTLEIELPNFDYKVSLDEMLLPGKYYTLTSYFDENDEMRYAVIPKTPSIATTSTAGIVKPDGTSITIDNNGVLSAVSSGGSDITLVVKGVM